MLSAAAQRVDSVWGHNGRSVRVVVCETDEEFESAASGLSDVTAAVTTPQGIFVGPSAVHSLTAQGQEVVLAHELTHARLGHYGHDRTALWVKEGAAEWTASQQLQMPDRELWPTLAAKPSSDYPAGPPDAEQFTSDAALAYETSSAYATFLVEAWGRPRFCRFVQQRPVEAVALRQSNGAKTGGKTFKVWLTERLSRS